MGEEGFRTVEQDSDDEIAASVYAIIATPRGSRIEQSDYGVEDPTFEQLPIDDAEWIEQVGIWEPRAQISTTQDILDLTADIRVKVSAT